MPTTVVTITDTTKNYRVIDLIRGVILAAAGAGAGHIDANAHPCCRKLTIQADPGNGATKIFYGDGAMTAADSGVLPAGDSNTWQSIRNDVALTNKYLRSDTNGGKVLLDWEYA